MSESGNTAPDSTPRACVHNVPQPDILRREDVSGHTCRYAKIGTPRTEAALLTKDSPINCSVEDLEGVTLGGARDTYVAHRKGEAANGRYSSGTKLGRARRRYAALLDADRRLRREYDNPSVAMLTLVGEAVSGGAWIPPVEHAEAFTESLNNVFATLRYHLDGYQWEYAAIRGATDQGVSHWHILLWVEGTSSTEIFVPAIDSHVNNCGIARAEQHPYEEAVKLNTTPSSGLEHVGKLDRERGRVSKLARYGATQIPHISSVEALSEAQALQGAVEWAAQSRGFRNSSGIKVSKGS